MPAPANESKPDDVRTRLFPPPRAPLEWDGRFFRPLSPSFFAKSRFHGDYRNGHHFCFDAGRVKTTLLGGVAAATAVKCLSCNEPLFPRVFRARTETRGHGRCPAPDADPSEERHRPPSQPRQRILMFPTTHWTLLAKATSHGDTQAAEALASFCQRYRQPIIAFIQRHGVPRDQVEDVAHDFLLRLLKHSALKRADRTKGRFRSYLCTALARFLISRSRVSQGPGGQAPLSLDEVLENLTPGDSGVEDITFDRDWAVALMQAAFDDLILTSTATKERSAAWPVVVKFLLPGQVPPPYEEAAAQIGTSPAALRVDISRQRARFREFLRDRVLQTVSSPAEVESEMRHLFEVLNSTD